VERSGGHGNKHRTTAAEGNRTEHPTPNAQRPTLNEQKRDVILSFARPSGRS
jgi:hypothetical protein